MEVRLNKFISDSGFCSRREADRLIESRRVTVNSRVAEIGQRVSDTDTIKVNGTPIENRSEIVYIALNKPVGIVSTTDPTEPNNIVDFVNYPARIFNIGRLDKPSEGLILLTNDGNIVNKILRAANNHDKEYEVVVNRPITEQFLQKMSAGVPILGTVTKRCKITQEDRFKFRIILTQGLNRQIRRMCEFLDYEVVNLKRVRIMNIKLNKLPTGHWRVLTPNEIEVLNKSIEGSEGGEVASKDAGAGARTGASSRTGTRTGSRTGTDASARTGTGASARKGTRTSADAGAKKDSKRAIKANRSFKPKPKTDKASFSKRGAPSRKRR